MPECMVTGTLRDAKGNLLPSTKIVFEREGVVGQDGAVLIPRLIEVTSDSNGLITVELFPGVYRGVTIGIRKPETFTVGVPEAASANLADLIDQFPPITPSVLALVQEARDETLEAAEAAVAANRGLWTFSNRAAAVVWTLANPNPPLGTVLRWPGCAIRYIGTSTAIADIVGYTFDPEATPDHWQENTIPGTTNMRGALQSAVGVAAAIRRRVKVPGIYFAATSFTMNASTSLFGDPTSTDSTDRAGWMTKPAALILPAAATISMLNGTSLEDLLIRRDGLNTGAVDAAVVAAYSGTAVTINSSGADLTGLTILGFERGVDTSASNTARLRMHDLTIDCTNGVRIITDKGGPDLTRVRCEPILTSGDLNNRRIGVGIEFDGSIVGPDGTDGVDAGSITECFTFNDFGYKFTDVAAVNSNSCMSDGPRDTSEGICMQILGTSNEHSHISFKGASHRGGVYINCFQTNRECTHDFKSLHLWQNRDYGMLVERGRVYVNGGATARNPASYHDPADLGLGFVADGPNAVIFVDDYEFAELKVAMRAINGGVIYYGPNVRFGQNVTVRFEGDCRPMVAPDRIVRTGVKPRFYAATIAPGSGTLAMTANLLQFWPILMPDGYPVDRNEWEITTGVVGNAILGLFSHDPQINGPGDLLYETVSLPTASAGVFVQNMPLISGRPIVWQAATFDATPTVRAGTAGSSFLGGVSLSGVAAGYSVPRTFGALPADARGLSLALTGTRLLTALYQS